MCQSQVLSIFLIEYTIIACTRLFEAKQNNFSLPSTHGNIFEIMTLKKDVRGPTGI